MASGLHETHTHTCTYASDRPWERSARTLTLKLNVGTVYSDAIRVSAATRCSQLFVHFSSSL